MGKTVLITGASSGIGQATALLFAKQGWMVAATVRSPEKSAQLAQVKGITLFRLDVTQLANIQTTVSQVLTEFGQIDVLINNAGYALVGPFEAATPEQIQQQFATNVFGLMEMTRAVLPHFRERRQGVVVNVASVGGHLTFPLYSLYHGTKWAVEGFSESLQYELEPLGIRVKVIEPGPIKTDFYDRSADVLSQPGLTAYNRFIAQALPTMQRAGATGATPEQVAEVIYRATIDPSRRLRYSVNAALLLSLRKLLPDGLFFGLVRRLIIKD